MKISTPGYESDSYHKKKVMCFIISLEYQLEHSTFLIYPCRPISRNKTPQTLHRNIKILSSENEALA